MRRFAIFATVLFVLVVIGSQPGTASSQNHSFCACMASRAALLMRSIKSTPTTTTAQAPSQPQLSETASASAE
jgi:hypothetical protein